MGSVRFSFSPCLGWLRPWLERIQSEDRTAGSIFKLVVGERKRTKIKVTSISQRSKVDHGNAVVVWLLCDKSVKNKDTLRNIE